MVEPAGVVTVIGPVVTPLGAVAIKVVLFVGAVKFADWPLKATLLAPRKFCPVRMTTVPPAPLVGVKLVILAGK